MSSLPTIYRLKIIIANVKHDESLANMLPDDIKIIEEIGFDSLAIIELMLTVEEEFELNFNFGQIDIRHIYTIRSFADYIESQLILEGSTGKKLE